MTDDVLLPFEGLCAAVAGEKPLGTVDVLFVDLQVAAVRKGLLADLTAVDDICFNSMVCTNNEHSGKLQQYWNTNVLVLVSIRYLLFFFAPYPCFYVSNKMRACQNSHLFLYDIMTH